MPRNPDMPCASCGRPMWRSRTSRPEGEATCNPCRRKLSAAKKVAPAKPTQDRECPICHAVFHQSRADQVYCSRICRESRRGWVNQKVATTEERGYGREHRLERAKWKPLVEAGQINCCICGYWIEPGTPWHLDHTPDRAGYRGAAHAACNIKDGARRGAQRTPRPKLSKVCTTCGTGFSTIYPKQAYCSRECRPSATPKPKRRPRPPSGCSDCGATLRRGKRCARCAPEHNRRYARNHYRARVGIPLEAALYSRAE